MISFVSRYARALGAGALAGLLAAFVMTVAMLVLRLVVGVPMTFELGGDRVIPNIPVSDFLKLLAAMGGPIAAKNQAFWGTLGGQIAAGALLGLIYAIVVERQRESDPERAARALRGSAGAKMLGIVLLVISVATIIFLWPELDSNYRGLTGALAGIVTGAGLVLAIASFGLSLIAFYRAFRRPAAAGAGAADQSGGGSRRREFVAAGIGGAAVLASGGLSALLHKRSALGYDGLTIEPDNLRRITPTDDFYVVTKNIIDPRVRKSLWQLSIGGEVENPMTYDFDALAALPAVEREITLECISNGVGGGLISNARWKGAPMRALLEAARPMSSARQVFLQAADGYTHSLDLERVMKETTIIAYEMNGAPLPDRHGYPVRLLVPGSYGELSVKWITRVDFLADPQKGYYSKQGWDADFLHTMSRFTEPTDGRSLPAGQVLPVSGIAFAGDRGISKVEVSPDDGETWERARIDYSPVKTAWTLWSHGLRRLGRPPQAARARDGRQR